jgi:hypothetical protein
VVTAPLSAVPVDDITASAREVRFSRVALTLFLGFFWAIGWAAGHAWLGMVMMALAIRRGWREGQGIPEPPSPPPPLLRQRQPAGVRQPGSG